MYQKHVKSVFNLLSNFDCLESVSTFSKGILLNKQGSERTKPIFNAFSMSKRRRNFDVGKALKIRKKRRNAEISTFDFEIETFLNVEKDSKIDCAGYFLQLIPMQ